MCRFLGLRARLRAQREVATNLSWVGAPPANTEIPMCKLLDQQARLRAKHESANKNCTLILVKMYLSTIQLFSCNFF
ncbi:hypothetical protein FAM18108_01111 [Lacticaseibacillus paracasei]|nr:hypothetical protein FAM18108_01111 [Lacticaseibacillus paracasei]RND91318.1 hypothetical protein FAM18175_00791 [Lacticaseibacillus paracasei]RND93353.1 hypothetical protein FAM19317_00861 [Lacticaseibacillus paracasei]RND94134.1 hypothetical protein FAM19353_01937 [Lacticaseibacillus paracasei]RNE37184.1 hypothetical protein FAM6410_01036 [Lacticaseibacillus paracasei]